MVDGWNEHYEGYEITRREVAFAHSTKNDDKKPKKYFETAYISSYETSSGHACSGPLTPENADIIFEFASDTTRDIRHANHRSKYTQWDENFVTW